MTAISALRRARLSAATLALCAVLGAGSAPAFECAGVSLPSNIVICSDPELMRLADERQAAINEARARIGEDAWSGLWEDQKAWVRSYATACGVPPDSPPPIPVTVSVKACFNRAALARIAYLRSYAVATGPARAQTRPPTAVLDRIGPGFNCANATRPLAMMICADRELARVDLLFNQAYWALLQQLSEGERQRLKEEDVTFLDNVQEECGIPRDAGAPANMPLALGCIKQRYKGQWATWLSRLRGAAYDEATRPLERHILLERKLRQLGFLSTPPIPEGVYGPSARQAILAWQRARSRSLTGFLGGADALALEQETSANFPTARVEQTRRCADPAPPDDSCFPVDLEVGATAHVRRIGGAKGCIKKEDLGNNGSSGCRTVYPYESLTVANIEGDYDLVVSGSVGSNLLATVYVMFVDLGRGPPLSTAPVPSLTAVTPIAPTRPAPQPKSEHASLGTAFAINSVGEFLTNYHVVKGCAALRVRISGEWQAGRMIANDERNDLAVIRARMGAPVPALHFREGKGVRPADPVVVLGFPYAGLLTKNLQVTTGAVSALSGVQDDTRYLQLTAPVQPGNSGGPLLDLSGNVVGIVSAMLSKIAVAEATGTLPENINFAIKSGNAREFLEANRIEYQTSASTTKLDAADVGEMATKSVVMVECQ